MNKLFAGTGLIVLMVALSGCGSSNSTTNSPSTSGVSLESLRSAPTQLAVGSGTFALSATLYRNLQPTISPTGIAVAAPLNATFTVAGTSGAAVPTGLTVTSAYVVQDTTVGTFSTLSPTISTTINASSSLAVPTDSTNYTPGSTAEVVVQVKAADGTTYLLKEPSVKIGSVS